MVRDQWGNLARMPGLHTFSFSKDILGFLITSHPKDGAFYSIVSMPLYWGIRTRDRPIWVFL